MPPTRDRTERPREPLLQLGIGFLDLLCRIGGRRRSEDASLRGVAVEIPPCKSGNSNPDWWKPGREQCLVGSLTGAVAS
jgi:hypothetical protein